MKIDAQQRDAVDRFTAAVDRERYASTTVIYRED
jgi:hypothetical protein